MIALPDLMARLPLSQGWNSDPRAARTFPFSVYLLTSDSDSNIRPLTDPSVLLHVLLFKSQASRDNAVNSLNHCVCLNACPADEFFFFVLHLKIKDLLERKNTQNFSCAVFIRLLSVAVLELQI